MQAVDGRIKRDGAGRGGVGGGRLLIGGRNKMFRQHLEEAFCNTSCTCSWGGGTYFNITLLYCNAFERNKDEVGKGESRSSMPFAFGVSLRAL